MSSEMFNILVVFCFWGFATIRGQVYDLTWSFGNDTIYWTRQQPFVFTKQAYVSGYKYS